MKIFEVVEQPKLAYHVTPARNVKYIQQEGLVPGIGDASSSYGETEERIYLFPSVAEAEDAVMGWMGDQYETEILALLQVNITGIPVKKDVDWEYYTNSPISPDRITVVSMDI